VGRVLRERDPAPEDLELPPKVASRRVVARNPGDLWHIDLTAVPTGGGFWVPWLPFTLPQRWPFCWWVLVVVDHVSRAALGFKIYRDMPSAAEVQASLDRIAHGFGRHPRHVITDKGGQFRNPSWRTFCRTRGIRSRYGAVGKHGSIAIVERFIRAMKTECTSKILVPLADELMERELALYVVWYNEHRPHQMLDGRSPNEVLLDQIGTTCLDYADASDPVRLRLSYLAGRPHLPIVELQQVA
jgi:transposase InsO family protein